MPTPKRTPKPPHKRPTVARTQRINVDLPPTLLSQIDAAADRLGVSRQAWIKIRLADWIDAHDPGLACAVERARAASRENGEIK